MSDPNDTGGFGGGSRESVAPAERYDIVVDFSK